MISDSMYKSDIECISQQQNENILIKKILFMIIKS